MLGELKPKGPKGSRLRKGEVFAYVGLIHNLKDLKVVGPCWEHLKPKGPKAPSSFSCRGQAGFSGLGHLVVPSKGGVARQRRSTLAVQLSRLCEAPAGGASVVGLGGRLSWRALKSLKPF